MRVFVTGSTGLCGGAVVPLLASRGHHVVAFVRSPESAEKVKSWGAKETVQGDLTDVDILAEAASKVDGVIHMGFDHASAFVPGGMEIALKKDIAAITAMCDALIRSGPASDGNTKVFVNTAGLLGMVGEDEDSPKAPQDLRGQSESLTLDYSKKGIRTMNVRLSPVTHGPTTEHPFISVQIAKAKANGYVAVVGKGDNVWSSVHVKDAASVFVLGLEKAPAGVNLHAVQEEGIPLQDIADFISKKLDLPVKSVPASETASWGFIGIVIGLNSRGTAKKTKEWLGWEPKEYGLFEEMDKNYKF